MSKKIPDYVHENLDQDCKICPIPIASIVDVEETQIREAYNQQVIDDLKLLFKEDDEDKESKDYSDYLDPKGHKEIEECYPLYLPPIIVARCPDDREKFWILDGHHRYQAAVESGRKWISAQIINPEIFDIRNIDDLRFLQARENTNAVANRTNETKRRQVLAAILMSDWNANQIARYCHVSWNLVVDVIQECLSSGKYERKSTPSDKVQEAIDKPENASKSNRELAKELGVGEATVRRVRQNQKVENDAPSADKVGDCSGCLRLALKPYVVTAQNGEKLRFCNESCALEYACRKGLIFDAESARFFDNDEDFRNADEIAKKLKDVSGKAKEAVKKQKHTIQLTFSDVDNMATIVDEFYNWLGNRRETFWILFGEKMNSEENK